MRVVFAGTPEVAIPCLQALLDSHHDVVGVITRPDAPAGRGRSPRPSPVKQLALAHDLPVLTPQHPREESFVADLAALAPDCVPVVAYGALVPRAARQVARHGWVNLHFSLLPAWRGAAPVQHALLAGDDVSGLTVFSLAAGMDTGPVLATMTERLRPEDTAGAVLDRFAVAGAALLVQVMDALQAGGIQAVPQPQNGVSLAPKLGVDDAKVDWTKPALTIDRLVRACTPAPGAWTTFAGRRLKLGPVTAVESTALESSAIESPEPLRHGHLRLQGADVLVGTGTRPLRLGTVQPEGKRAMSAVDWARGAHLDPDAVLGEETHA